jgi:hypothetical protein
LAKESSTFISPSIWRETVRGMDEHPLANKLWLQTEQSQPIFRQGYLGHQTKQPQNVFLQSFWHFYNYFLVKYLGIKHDSLLLMILPYIGK